MSGTPGRNTTPTSRPWGDTWPPGMDTADKKMIYLKNEILTGLELQFENGLIGELLLRHSIADAFDDSAGHQYWDFAGTDRLKTVETNRAHRFRQICVEVLGRPAAKATA